MCIEIEAQYEECIGMPGFGSIRMAMTARMVLSEEYSSREKAGEVRVMQTQMAASLRDRVEKKMDESIPHAIERAMAAAELKARAEQSALKVAGERGYQAEMKKQLGNRAALPAPQPSAPEPRRADPQVTERDWDGHQVEPPWEDESQDPDPPPARSSGAPPSNSNSHYQGPPSNGNGQQHGPPSGGNTVGNGPVQWGPQGIPRSGFTMAGAMKNQPKDVRDRVYRLMLAAGRTAQGWTHQHEGKTKPVMYKDLSNEQVSWLTASLSKPESRSHAEPALNGNGRY